jgi:hypothetical protein
MKHIKLFEQFLNEKSYDIKLNDGTIETISDSEIEDYIEDGYNNLVGIVDQWLQIQGYEYDDTLEWSWKNPSQAKVIARKFKIKEI